MAFPAIAAILIGGAVVVDNPDMAIGAALTKAS